MDFEPGFGKLHRAPRLSPTSDLDLTLIIDDASVELFADSGLTVMTAIFFPNKPYDKIILGSKDKLQVKQLSYVTLKSALE